MCDKTHVHTCIDKLIILLITILCKFLLLVHINFVFYHIAVDDTKYEVIFRSWIAKVT